MNHATQLVGSHRERTTVDLNHLRHGRRYTATVRAGVAVTGDYLGIEVNYDEWCILLRTSDGTASIRTVDLTSVSMVPAAA
jgi:hypothetical protein